MLRAGRQSVFQNSGFVPEQFRRKTFRCEFPRFGERSGQEFDEGQTEKTFLRDASVVFRIGVQTVVDGGDDFPDGPGGISVISADELLFQRAGVQQGIPAEAGLHIGEHRGKDPVRAAVPDAAAHVSARQPFQACRHSPVCQGIARRIIINPQLCGIGDFQPVLKLGSRDNVFRRVEVPESVGRGKTVRPRRVEKMHIRRGLQAPRRGLRGDVGVREETFVRETLSDLFCDAVHPVQKKIRFIPGELPFRLASAADAPFRVVSLLDGEQQMLRIFLHPLQSAFRSLPDSFPAGLAEHDPDVRGFLRHARAVRAQTVEIRMFVVIILFRNQKRRGVVDPLRAVARKDFVDSGLARIRERHAAFVAVDAPSARRPLSFEIGLVRRLNGVQDAGFPDRRMNAGGEELHALRLQKAVNAVGRSLNGLPRDCQTGIPDGDREAVESPGAEFLFGKGVVFQNGIFPQKNHVARIRRLCFLRQGDACQSVQMPAHGVRFPLQMFRIIFRRDDSIQRICRPDGRDLIDRCKEKQTAERDFLTG